jgi:hypothetical protein
MAVLVRKHMPLQTTPLDDGGVELASAAARTPHDEWFGVYQKGSQDRARPSHPGGEGLGVRLPRRLELRARDAGDAQSSGDAGAEVDRDDASGASTSTSSPRRPASRRAARSTGDRLHVRFGALGAEQKVDLPLTEPIRLPSALRPRLARRGAKPGERFTAPAFNPMTMKSEPLTWSSSGGRRSPARTGRSTRSAYARSTGTRGQAWLAPDGSALREEASLGFPLVREPAEVALTGADAAAPVDLVVASRIRVHCEIEDPRHLRRLTLRGLRRRVSLIPTDPPRQTMAGDRLVIAREEMPVPAAPGLPPPGSDSADVAALLVPTPFIESDDPAVRRTAEAIVGSEQDGRIAARRLLEWIGKNMKQEPS